MTVTGIHHVGIPVYDLERASRFYQDVLGIPLSKVPSYSPATIVFLDCGGSMVHLIRYGDQVERPGRRGIHWAFEVENVEQAFDRVVESGCEIEIPISSRPDNTLYFFSTTPKVIGSSYANTSQAPALDRHHGWRS